MKDSNRSFSNNYRRIILLVPALFFLFSIHAQEPPYYSYLDHPWVDSVLKSLSVDEKIAQSIWVATWSNRDISHYIEINRQVETLGIGGLIFFQGTAEKQAELINQYQSASKVPLAIAMDCEWGAGMRLDNIVDFPYQMTLGAISDDSLVYRMGLEIGDQLNRLGITVNLAPVADINNNPNNPVINYRSFGEIKDAVAVKSAMYTKGLQEKGILATAKHFPGHGDTDTDSHLDLPVLGHSRERFDTLELYPFRYLVNSGIGGVMTAHLNIPAMGTKANLPSTLSPDVIKGVLRRDLGFKGIVITDAMNMKGVTKYYDPGEADALAYLAGNDVIEFVDNPELSIRAIRNLLEEGKITADEIDMRCRRILAMKYWTGLSGFKPIEKEHIEQDINRSSTLAFIRELYAGSLTLLTNDNMVPVKNLEKVRIATLAVNSDSPTSFQEMAGNYTAADHYQWKEGLSDNQELLEKLSAYDLVITGIYATDQRPFTNFGITDGTREFMKKLNSGLTTITVYFGNPYAIDRFPELELSGALLLAYQENDFTEELSAQLIFGAIGAHGKLPVTINERFRAGFGLVTPGNLRLQYGYPENAGVSSGRLEQKIDSIALAGLAAGAYPGCEIVAARNGIVMFHKTYGYHTFDNREAVAEGDLWDLASVTKVSASLAGLMKLDDMGLFSTSGRLSEYWPAYKHSDKGDLMMDEILAHQAGLVAWIPYWKKTVKDNGRFKSRSIRYEKSEKFPLVVSNGLYLNENYSKKIYREIRKSPLGEKKYLYSGLTFFLYPRVIENLSGMRYEDFLNEKIYHRLGAYNIVFNPFRFYSMSRIVPTELDTLFRHQLLHGYVHDEGAAMMGGFSGNAGLFATGNDLIKLVEMYRRMGNYGGEQVIAESIVRKYSTAPFLDNDNRRGLGFDKPQTAEMVENGNDIYPCPAASLSSFGHSGYTGTFIWADPEKGISYVFLSNRVYPTRENNLISDLNIRTSILQEIYDSIKGS